MPFEKLWSYWACYCYTIWSLAKNMKLIATLGIPLEKTFEVQEKSPTCKFDQWTDVPTINHKTNCIHQRTCQHGVGSYPDYANIRSLAYSVSVKIAAYSETQSHHTILRSVIEWSLFFLPSCHIPPVKAIRRKIYFRQRLEWRPGKPKANCKQDQGLLTGLSFGHFSGNHRLVDLPEYWVFL